MLISTDPTIYNLQIGYFTQFNQFSAIIVQVFILIRSISYTLFSQKNLWEFSSKIDHSCSKISSKSVAIFVLELKSPNNIIAYGTCTTNADSVKSICYFEELNNIGSFSSVL